MGTREHQAATTALPSNPYYKASQLKTRNKAAETKTNTTPAGIYQNRVTMQPKPTKQGTQATVKKKRNEAKRNRLRHDTHRLGYQVRTFHVRFSLQLEERHTKQSKPQHATPQHLPACSLHQNILMRDRGLIALTAAPIHKK